MDQEKSTLGNLSLVGIYTRTSNTHEMSPDTAQIGKMLGRYFGEGIANRLQHRSTPGVTYAVYTDYESDEHGEYTYFLGEAVDSLEGQDLSAFKAINIPSGAYQKFTTASGPMPDIVIGAWQHIWGMTQGTLGGERSYIADFERYDERSADPSRAVVDIFIGVKG